MVKSYLFYKNKTHKSFEIIIVDSGSTDKTLEIVNRFTVKLLKIDPRDFNYSYALNFGIKHARGKYICIISGHSIPISDTWLNDGLALLRKDNVAAVSGPYSEFILGYFNRLLGRISLVIHKKIENYTPWITNTNAIIKKDLWKKYYFDESLLGSEDYDWGKEMISRGYNVIKVRSFAVFHSHWLLGKPGYFASIPVWKKQITEIDKKIRN